MKKSLYPLMDSTLIYGFRLLIPIFLILISNAAFAESLSEAVQAASIGNNSQELPLYELGVGVGSSYGPAYPGSDQNQLWVLPFPHLIYRGNIFRADKEGNARARISHGNIYELNVSSGGGLPSSSSGLDARNGMPNLEWLGEVGPALDLYLQRDFENGDIKLSLPIRAAFSSNFRHLKDHGYIFEPSLLWTLPHFAKSSIKLNFILSADFADRRFMSYFYEVEPYYSTNARPAYQASGGYLQSSLTAGAIWWIPNTNFEVSPFVTFETLKNSANQVSPLMRRTSQLSLSFVMIWEFAKSKKTVSASP